MATHVPEQVSDTFTPEKALEIAKDKCSQNGLTQPTEEQPEWFGIYQTMLRLENLLAESQREMWHYKVKWQGAERMIETFKSTVATWEKRLDRVCDSVRLICDRIVESNVTHGQKNGMVILLSSLVTNWRRSVNIEDHDVPF